MKNSIVLVGAFLIFLSANTLAQSTGFNYQAIIRNAQGVPIQDQPVTLKFDILYNPSQGSSYTETQTVSTNQVGGVDLLIGRAFPNQFDTIQWNAGKRYLRVEMLVNGAFQALGQAKEIVHPPFAGGKEIWVLNPDTVYTFHDVAIGASNINASLKVQGTISSGSRIFIGRNGTEDGFGLLHFKNGTSEHGGLIRASKGDDDDASAPMLYQATSHDFSGRTSIRGFAVGLPYSNGNVLDLVSYNAQGALTFGKLNQQGDSYIQSSTTGASSRLVLNPHGGSSNSVEIVGTVSGLPYTSGNILSLTSTNAEGGIVFGKLNQGGDSYIQSFRNGHSSNLYLNPEAQGTRVVVPALEITGADIIEKTHSDQTLSAGEVVVLDPSKSNSVQRCKRAYDRLAFGIVSGAGGIPHAIELTAPGLLDGNINVAIAGRVKVKVTGKVSPGDLLTSSDKPGYAMKAKKRRKAYGAIIGKALSAPDANGLVLVLVNLQ